MFLTHLELNNEILIKKNNHASSHADNEICMYIDLYTTKVTKEQRKERILRCFNAKHAAF